MTYGIVVIIFLIVLALGEILQLYLIWTGEQEYKKFRDKYEKGLKRPISLPLSSLGKKGKVIPYRK